MTGVTAAVHWDAVLLGMRLGVDGPVTWTFLTLTAAVWLAAALFARAYLAGDPRRARFWRFFAATAAGNVGLVLARDVASFYFFFSLMTFAAWGLIVHAESGAARRAARVYLVASLLGEVLLLAALVWIAGTDVNLPLREVPGRVAASPARGVIVALVLAGFGIKAGAIVLHVWLPLAHPVAPTPASAVLSGAMIKAGLLGWLQFLPLGAAALPGAGAVCLTAGLLAGFYAIAVGLAQRDPKTILAYSSVSQMGFMTAGLGAALAAPRPAEAAAAVSAIAFYALHHALAKGALFLGVGVAGAAWSGWPRRLVILGLVWPALDVAGAPLTSGALAKLSLKHALEGSPWSAVPLGALLSVGAAGTTLLLARFVSRALRDPHGPSPGPGLWVPWAALLVVDLLLFVWPPLDREDLALLVRPGNLASALWPVLAGLAAFALLRVVRGRRGAAGDDRARIPPGDLLVVLEVGLRWGRRGFGALARAAARLGERARRRAAQVPAARIRGTLARSVATAERGLADPGAFGIGFLILVVLALALARLA
ncbi:MAG TPA: complex I subunit 5 family protein [Kofleriaceae bacterium]|nr:complex I subunit 5 family protein [Kofleriaceae bacterium]